jgi:dihydroxyacetone kinase DhaKLM complex PTS-EIIA-like component DhaM
VRDVAEVVDVPLLEGAVVRALPEAKQCSSTTTVSTRTEDLRYSTPHLQIILSSACFFPVFL